MQAVEAEAAATVAEQLPHQPLQSQGLADGMALDHIPQQHHIHMSDVEKALQKLPAEQREILMLVGAGGASYEEAAAITGCAVGTVKSRLARGRVALAALINGPDEAVLKKPVRGTLPKHPNPMPSI